MVNFGSIKLLLDQRTLFTHLRTRCVRLTRDSARKIIITRQTHHHHKICKKCHPICENEIIPMIERKFIRGCPKMSRNRIAGLRDENCMPRLKKIWFYFSSAKTYIHQSAITGDQNVAEDQNLKARIITLEFKETLVYFSRFSSGQFFQVVWFYEKNFVWYVGL